MARALALAAAIAAALLAVVGAGGAGAQTPKRGGTVVFGPINGPPCLSPLDPACGAASPQFFWITEKVIPGAFHLAPDSTWRPTLVSGATFFRRPPFTITYRIRSEARWSDGVPVTARDFVFTHQAILAHLAESPSAEVHRLVRSVRAVDAKTVRVVLRSRDARWRQLLFFVVLPRHALAGESLGRIWFDRIHNPKTGRAIGSGPFLLEGWEEGKLLTLVRNPRYWGPHTAYVDRLVLRLCQACNMPPPADVLDAVRGGDVDIALARETGIAPELRSVPGTSVVTLASNGWEHLDLRLGPGGHPALRNKLVRRALAYGIDRAAIVRELFAEIDRGARPSNSAVYLDTSRYYAPNWSAYTYRPALARSLLERAGCRRGGDGIYSCAGERLSLRFLTTAGARLRERGLALMQPQLRRAGIEAVLGFVPGIPLFNQLMPRGEFDVVSFTWFASDAIGGKPVFGCGGPQNWTGYCQRLVTADLDQAERILDARQRARVLNRVDRQLARDVPVIPLYQVPFILSVRRQLRNVVASPNNVLWNAENWWLAEPR